MQDFHSLNHHQIKTSYQVIGQPLMNSYILVEKLDNEKVDADLPFCIYCSTNVQLDNNQLAQQLVIINNNKQQVTPPMTIIQKNSPMVTKQIRYVPQQGKFIRIPRSPFQLCHDKNLSIINQQFCKPCPIELIVQKKCYSLSDRNFTIFDPTKKQVLRMPGRDFNYININGLCRTRFKYRIWVLLESQDN